MYICLVNKMDSHEISMIQPKFNAIFSSVTVDQGVAIQLYAVLIQLVYYVELWALHFKREVGKMRCNQNSKKLENHVICGKGRNKNSLKKNNPKPLKLISDL